jgi:hypothetical protein
MFKNSLKSLQTSQFKGFSRAGRGAGVLSFLMTLSFLLLISAANSDAASFKNFSGVNHGGSNGPLWDHSLGWMRQGYNWEGVEPTQGTWNTIDGSMITDYQAVDGNVLPVLCYSGTYAWKGAQTWEVVDHFDSSYKYKYTYVSGDQFTKETFKKNIFGDWVSQGTETVTGSSYFPITAENVTYWQDYVTKIVSALHASPYNVQYFQIWNEMLPGYGFWMGNTDQYFQRIHFPAATIIHNLGGKVVHNGTSDYNSVISWLDDYNAWDSIDVVDLHYVSLSAFDSVYSQMVSRGYGDKGLWQTEWGYSFVDDGAVANSYPRFMYWALQHGLSSNPDKFKMFWFQWNDPEVAGQAQYGTLYYADGTKMYNHGKSLLTVGKLLDGDGIAVYPNVTTNLSYSTCNLNEAAASVEGFSVEDRIVVAVHLPTSAVASTSSVQITIPNVTAAQAGRVFRYDQSGYRTDITSSAQISGGNLVVTVPTADSTSSSIQSWVNARAMQTFYVEVKPMTLTDAKEYFWDFRNGNTEWKDQSGSVATVENGRLFTQVQNGLSDDGVLEVAMDQSVLSTNDYLVVDAQVDNNAAFMYADLQVQIETDERCIYAGSIQPGIYTGSNGASSTAVSFKLFDLVPQGGAGSLMIGDRIKKLKITVWGYSFGLYVDNVLLVAGNPATSRYWSFDAANTEWYDQSGSVATLLNGQLFTQVQNGLGGTATLAIDLRKKVYSADDYVKLDTRLTNNAAYAYVGYKVVVTTNNGEYYAYLGDGQTHYDSVGEEFANAQFKFCNLTPSSGQAAIAVGDIITGVKVTAWGYSFSLSVDNITISFADGSSSSGMSWTFDDDSMDWYDQSGAAPEYSNGAILTQVQNGKGGTAILGVDLWQEIMTLNDYVELDAVVNNNPAFQYAAFRVIVTTINGEYYGYIGDGASHTDSVGYTNARFKLFDLTPASGVPALAVGDIITSLKVAAWGYSFSMIVDNVDLVLSPSTATPGDFNNDDKINATDIDLLYKAIRDGSSDYDTYDLTTDDKINSADVDCLVKDILKTYYGDANLDGAVGVADLSFLAANYNTASGASWANGDFDGNGAVGVSDLSILAANYNSGSTSTLSWADAYAQAFGTTSDDADSSSDDSADESEDTTSTICSSLGLSLIAGLALMGLLMVKMEE